MDELPDVVADEIRAHAKESFPKESCGLLLVRKGRLVYRRCANLATAPDQHFVLSPQDLAQSEDEGEVVAIVHSHPNTPPQPSQADLVGCEASGLPWLIVNWPTGTIHRFAPSGYEAPLIGRTFHHGVLDCYSLVRDYYSREVGITLPDFSRDSHWWLKGQNLYVDNFEKAGFMEFELADLQAHDVLLMQVASPVINHAAIYLGNNQILQHCSGRLSSRDVFGGGWRRATRRLLRHKQLI